MTNTPVTLTVNTSTVPPTVLAILSPDPDAKGIQSVKSWDHAHQLAGDRGLTYADDELLQIEELIGKR